MAEFCLDCFNKMNETDYAEDEVEISKDLELCEGCGEYKRVVIKLENDYYLFFPFWLTKITIKFISKIFLLPYLIYKKLKK